MVSVPSASPLPALIILYLQERMGERTLFVSPLRSSHQLSPSFGSARGNHHCVLAPSALRYGILPLGMVRDLACHGTKRDLLFITT